MVPSIVLLAFKLLIVASFLNSNPTFISLLTMILENMTESFESPSYERINRPIDPFLVIKF
jgi:hypothetical protein